MMDFAELTATCAVEVHPVTMQRLVRVESAFNPYAIGVVGARLERQPRSLGEALSTVAALESQGFNYSVGLAQVNQSNFQRLNLTPATAFEPCRNLAAGAAILRECFERASATRREDQEALQAALSCYYSGNFTTGFAHGYVAKVVGAPTSVVQPPPIRVVPKLRAARVRGASSDTLPTRRTSVDAPREAQAAKPERGVDEAREEAPTGRSALLF